MSEVLSLTRQVLYDFTASPGSGELSVVEGEAITITNQNVEDGWIEVQNSQGEVGLVPDSHLTGPALGGNPFTEAEGTEAPQSPSVELADDIPAYPDLPDLSELSFIEPSAPSPTPEPSDCDAANPVALERAATPTVLEPDAASLALVPAVAAPSPPGLALVPAVPHPVWHQAGGPNPRIQFGQNTQDSKFSRFSKSGLERYLLCSSFTKCSSREKVPVHVGEFGPTWSYPESMLDCTVSNPKKGKLYGLKSYTEYLVTPNTTNKPVKHKYNHFEWLYDRLKHKFAAAIPIPSLPDKAVKGRSEEEVGKIRLERLQSWMSRMCRHPVIASSVVFQHFLTYKNDADWKMGKRKAEEDEKVGILIFSTVEPVGADLESIEIEMKCEKYCRFTKHMSDGIKEIITVCQEHWKRCIGPLAKEYDRIAHAFQIVSNVFDTSGFGGESMLPKALRATANTYEEIAQLVGEQPSLHYVMELNFEYKNFLACMPQTLAVHKTAVENLKEGDKLVGATKISPEERVTLAQRVSIMSYALQAEMNHFHSNRCVDYNRVMYLYLGQQISFYEAIAAKLRKAQNHFTPASV